MTYRIIFRKMIEDSKPENINELVLFGKVELINSIL